MTVGLLDRLAERSRARLLSEAFEHSRVAKAVTALSGTATRAGEIVEVNAACCGLLGYRREELVGQTFGILFDEADRPAERAAVKAMQRGELTDAVTQRRLTRHDGTRVWVSSRTVVVHDGLGGAYVVSEFVESTDEHVLAEREARFRALFDSSPIGMALVRQDGTALRANPAMVELLGYSAEELAGMPFATVTHPQDQQQDLRAFEEMRTGRRSSHRMHKRYVRKDGQVVWCLLSITVDRHGGDTPYLLVQMVDVTAERRSQEALRRSEEQSRAAFDHSPLGMAIADERGAYLRVNTAFSAMLGREPDQIVGRSYRDFTHPEDLDVSEDNRLAVAARPDDAITFEKRLLRADGETFWVRMTLSAITGPDGELHRLVQTEDVTARRAAEDRAARETVRLRATIAVQREVTAAAGERQRVLRLMVERTLQALPAGNGASVQLLDGDGTMWIAAGTGILAARTGMPVPTASLAGLAVTERATVRSDDTLGDSRASKAFSRRTGVRSLIVAPLLGVGARPLGVLLVASGRAHAFDEADEQQLTLLADALTGALRHADDAERNRDLLQRFAEVFDHSPLAKMVVQLRGEERGRVTLANPSLCKLLGYTPDEAVALHLTDLLAAPSAELAPGLEALATGAASRQVREVVLRRSDGETVTVAAYTSVITDDEGPAAAVIQLLDVTRERATQAALARSEEQFRTAFDASPLGLVISDEHGRFRRANRAAGVLTGRAPAELVGLSSHDITDVLDAEATDEARAAVQRDGEVRYDKRLSRPDGRTVWARVTVSVIPGPAGEAWRLVQLEDITAERAAALATERELRRLRATLAVQREVTAAAADRDATMQVVAARAVQLFAAADGAVVELLEGDEFVYYATAGTLDAAAGTRLRTAGTLSGTVLTTPVPALCTDTTDDSRVDRGECARLGIGSMLVAALHAGDTVIGALKVTSGSAGAFDDTDAQQLALLADSLSSALRHADDAASNAQLLAERTAALAGLAESETRFRLAFENSPLGLTLASLEPAQFGRYLHVNPAMTIITGYSTEELVGMTFRNLQHPDDAGASVEVMRAMIAGERDMVRAERRYLHKDGHVVLVSLRVAAVRDDWGRAQYLVIQVEDVTAARAAERALAERATQLEAANRLKRDLIGMLGHEIRTPLAAILGYTELATDDWDELDEQMRVRTIERIGRQARRLDDIVQEVLEMVRIEAGTIQAERTTVQLRTEVTRALSAADAEHVPVEGDDATALVNAGHFQQILVNLLSNAAKYGGGATAVRIVREGDRLQVHVEDNGPGVPDEFRHLLFERLARAERDSAKVRGTGLGLYIVRGLAQANHGDVRHRPNPAGGAVFVIDLEPA